ncbi:Pyruvate dehydrogenase E1 component subunit alpha protein [Marine Group I thaumarchaeote SCGC AAA799-B03]|uniref:Pyruvate dehydrogenase E1 component subunit alpha protein n=1 Tax=Marine Group I thaumarchaeote SCGC AAA799-B03 TaxID=1502289 RepID=A0A087S8U0_9ARCH|nr:Pyruvate dehydrogenase E1 component subunit alpha protein [Marine Group I thaumarchaeote SCGC AAA799-B03]
MNQLEILTEKILRIRIGQMMVNERYKNGEFKIPIHLAFGHESIAIAISEIMDENDKLLLTHRNIAYNLARLGKLRPIIDEYFLKSSGLDNGKSGSMNLINPKLGLIYTSSILGNNFSVAVGVAMSQKINQSNGITIVLGGDGSLEEGSFHESILMFKSLNLSGLLIIENNEWSMATKISERRSEIDLEKFASSYGVKYVKLFGNNPQTYVKELKKLKEISHQNQELICVEVIVSTLGDWTMTNEQNPNGKFINYHAGPAPTVDVKTCPALIRDDNSDPIFLLIELLGLLKLNEISDRVRSELLEEMK